MEAAVYLREVPCGEEKGDKKNIPQFKDINLQTEWIHSAQNKNNEK